MKSFTGQMREMRKLVVAISLSKSTANFSLTNATQNQHRTLHITKPVYQ